MVVVVAAAAVVVVVPEEIAEVVLKIFSLVETKGSYAQLLRTMKLLEVV